MLATRHLPEDWFEANISPVFKKGSWHEPSKVLPAYLAD